MSTKENKKLYKLTKELRETKDGISTDGSFRRIAIIPKDVYDEAIEKYGPDVITNKKKFKKAFIKDKEGRLCLTVDPETIGKLIKEKDEKTS